MISSKFLEDDLASVVFVGDVVGEVRGDCDDEKRMSSLDRVVFRVEVEGRFSMGLLLGEVVGQVKTDFSGLSKRKSSFLQAEGEAGFVLVGVSETVFVGEGLIVEQVEVDRPGRGGGVWEDERSITSKTFVSATVTVGETVFMGGESGEAVVDGEGASGGVWDNTLITTSAPTFGVDAGFSDGTTTTWVGSEEIRAASGSVWEKSTSSLVQGGVFSPGVWHHTDLDLVGETRGVVLMGEVVGEDKGDWENSTSSLAKGEDVEVVFAGRGVLVVGVVDGVGVRIDGPLGL